MKFLGICGSCRKGSANSSILRAIQQELIAHEWDTFSLVDLPYFDPDLQYSVDTPQSVVLFRSLAAQSDAIIISTPEYAHGIPGILKNALEWLFHEGTHQKHVFVVIGSSQGESTKHQLLDILATMDFKISGDQILLISGARSLLPDGTWTDSTNHLTSKTNLLHFCKKIESQLDLVT